MKKMKKRTVAARVVGVVPHIHGNGIGWMVRMTAPYFRFFFDSEMLFTSKEMAEAEAERWRKRKVKVTIES